MENALRAQSAKSETGLQFVVLILVLMENALRVSRCVARFGSYLLTVLILVLMENALRVQTVYHDK